MVLFSTAICNYSEEDKRHRLSLNVGDVLIICKETQHWYYGHLKSDKRGAPEKGIFPKSYVHVLDSVKVKDEYVVKRSEIVEEITRVLLEWRDLLNHFYLVRDINFNKGLITNNLIIPHPYSPTMRASSQYATRCAS